MGQVERFARGFAEGSGAADVGLNAIVAGFGACYCSMRLVIAPGNERQDEVGVGLRRVVCPAAADDLESGGLERLGLVLIGPVERLGIIPRPGPAGRPSLAGEQNAGLAGDLGEHRDGYRAGAPRARDEPAELVDARLVALDPALDRGIGIGAPPAPEKVDS